MDEGEIDREIARLDYENYKSEWADRLKYQIEYSHGAIRGLTLINGGAIIGLLTFVGNRGSTLPAANLRDAFILFAVGLALAVLTSICAFFAEGCYMRQTVTQLWNAQDAMFDRKAERDILEEYRQGNWWEIGAVLLAVLSLVCFVGGAWAAMATALR